MTGMGSVGGGLIKPKPFVPTHIPVAETWSPKLMSDEVSYGVGLPLSSFAGRMAWRPFSTRGGSVGREYHGPFPCRVREFKSCLSLLGGV